MSELVIIVPTYREAENILELVERVFRAVAGVDAEMLVVDDDSQDGIDLICTTLAHCYPVRLIIRKQERGLATAVLHGIRESQSKIVLVMDADLSHPPEEIPNLIQQIRGGADFVVGSRYVRGGSTDARWSLFRWINSKIATFLSRGLTNIKDPMAGFFAFPRHILKGTSHLSPVGYKIGLEILTKARCRKVVELPIAFVDRTRGTSKLTLKEQLLYLRHLRRLYRFTFPQTAEIVQFGAVGLSGVIVDLAVFLALTHGIGIHHQSARAVSFLVAASTNWFLNRWFTFVGGSNKHAGKQWAAFLLTATLGFIVNWGSYKILTDQVPYMAEHYLVAFWIGIFLGAGFNYTLSRLFVFRPFEERIPGNDSKDRMIS
jgi:dolichol-phosphate mannosyltransferase